MATAKDIIKQGLSLVYETPVTDADANRFSYGVLQMLVADCFDAENNSREDDDQLESIPIIGGSGDVDGDGEVTAADASLILRSLNGLNTLTEEQRANADVNGDGVITQADSTAILENLVGLNDLLEQHTIPYNYYLTTVALPCGVAWKWCEANGRADDARMYHQLYEESKHIGGRGKWNLK